MALILPDTDPVRSSVMTPREAKNVILQACARIADVVAGE